MSHIDNFIGEHFEILNGPLVSRLEKLSTCELPETSLERYQELSAWAFGVKKATKGMLRYTRDRVVSGEAGLLELPFLKALATNKFNMDAVFAYASSNAVAKPVATYKLLTKKNMDILRDKYNDARLIKLLFNDDLAFLP